MRTHLDIPTTTDPKVVINTELIRSILCTVRIGLTQIRVIVSGTVVVVGADGVAVGGDDLADAVGAGVVLGGGAG